MMKAFIKIVALLVIATGIIVIILIMTPVDPAVITAKERSGTQYWKLATGSEIAYIRIPGKRNQKPYPLIYLHGGPGAGVTNKEVGILGQLSEDGYDVYLYDQSGCGLSGRRDNIEEYTATLHKRDLEEIVKLTGAEKIILIAQSWGSILSLLYLADHPEKVEKLIITAPANIQPSINTLQSVPPPDSLHIRPYYTDRRYSMIATNLRARASIYSVTHFGKKLAPDKEADKLLTFLTTELNRSMVCDTSNAVVAEGTEGFYSHYMTLRSLAEIQDPRPVLRSLNTPMYIMKGQCDIQPWGFTAEYFTIFRNVEFKLIKNAGHNAFTEQPEEYINTIKMFLND